MDLLFAPSDRPEAEAMLVNQCGNGLPLLEKFDMIQLERVRFAALKLSDGKLELLRQAVDLAKTDWRDLLMSAGFGNVDEHTHWLPTPKAR
jgi:hypothetical protein